MVTIFKMLPSQTFGRSLDAKRRWRQVAARHSTPLVNYSCDVVGMVIAFFLVVRCWV